MSAHKRSYIIVVVGRVIVVPRHDDVRWCMYFEMRCGVVSRLNLVSVKT